MAVYPDGFEGFLKEIGDVIDLLTEVEDLVNNLSNNFWLSYANKCKISSIDWDIREITNKFCAIRIMEKVSNEIERFNGDL